MCDFKWQGIIVEGVSDSFLLTNLNYNGQLDNYDSPLDPDKAGTVVLLNSSSISEAKTGISTYNSHHNWPELKGYYGGLIHCEDSDFFDCNRAVEFMKYGQGVVKDSSRFINCNFDDLGRGVTLWANNGVMFTKCKFDNSGTRAILSYDSEIIVEDNCKFMNNLLAIELYSTYPNPFGHMIGSISTSQNVFNNNHYCIYGTNQGSTKGMMIENNRFENNDFGIFLSGSSHFNIKLNHFEDVAISQEIVACGDDESVISNNYMENNLISTSYVYNNEGSTFLHNCFVSTKDFDVLLNYTKIFPIIGSSTSSAGNCFTKSDIPSIYCNTNQAPVRYYSYGTSTSCYYPDTSNCSNVSIHGATSVASINCDTLLNPFDEYPHECTIPSSNNDILEGIDDYDDLISSTKINTTYTTEQKQELIAMYTRCQSTLIFKFVERGLDNPNVGFYNMIDTLVEFLDTRTEFKYKINAYGLYVYSGQYSRALNYLSNLTLNNEEEEDFVIVQNINLDYLNNIKNYVPSSGILDTLYEIGMKTHPYNGYARSLYHLLTDELIQLEIPEIDGVILPRTSNSTLNTLTIKSYPSPLFVDNFNIEFKGEVEHNIFIIEIYDVMGKRLISTHKKVIENEVVPINTNGWTNNIYLLSVKEASGKLLYSNKFIKIN